MTLCVLENVEHYSFKIASQTPVDACFNNRYFVNVIHLKTSFNKIVMASFFRLFLTKMLLFNPLSVQPCSSLNEGMGGGGYNLFLLFSILLYFHQIFVSRLEVW